MMLTCRMNGQTGRTLALTVLVALIVAVCSAWPASSSARLISWPDLLPDLPPLVDPLGQLTFDQRIELETVLWVRQLTDEEKQARPEVVEEAQRYGKQLADAGIDVDELVAAYVAFDAAYQERATKVRSNLDGASIRMQGYLLPLNFSDDGDTEFMLVPYVGACIHVPPPPANQIVLVTLKERFIVKELYTSVELAGTLVAEPSTPKLYLVDGDADIPTAYRLKEATLKVIE